MGNKSSQKFWMGLALDRLGLRAPGGVNLGKRDSDPESETRSSESDPRTRPSQGSAKRT